MNLEIKNLSVKVDNDYIMNDISFSVIEHQTCIIIGSHGYYNGILLKVFGGFQVPVKGKVFIEEKDIYSKTEDEITDLRRKISFVFQEGAFLSNLSIIENLLLPVQFYTKDFVKSKVMDEIMEYCAYFNLSDVLEKRPEFISYTSRKLLSLIRAMITHPEMIIIDKPLFNLDIRNQIKVINLLKEIKKDGKTLVMASNSFDIIKSIADQVVHIENEKIQKIMHSKNPNFLKEIKKLDILSDLVGVEDEV